MTMNPLASSAAIFEAGTQPRCPVEPGGQRGGGYQDSRWPPCPLASPLAGQLVRVAASLPEPLGQRASTHRAGGGAAAAWRGRGVRPPPVATYQRAGPARPGPPARGVCEDALLVAECQSWGAVAVVPAAAGVDAEHRAPGTGRCAKGREGDMTSSR